MKKRILAMMLASAMVVGLAGCGGSSDSKDTKEETKTEATAKTDDAEETEIQVFIAASLNTVMTELAEEYNKEHPEVKITYNADSSGTLLTQEQKPSIRKALATFRDAAKQLNANRQKTKHKDREVSL